MTRIYYPYTLNLDEIFILKDSLAHRLIHVLRLKIDEELFLFNEQNGDFKAKILRLTSKEVTLKTIQHIPSFPSSPLYTHLIQGISRHDRMDYSLQKATECGVNQITPLITQHSHHISKHHYEKKYVHWKNVIISAAEQCHRSDIPILEHPIHFDTLISSSSFIEDIILVFEPHSSKTFRHLPPSLKKISFIVGSEGGFSDKEIQTFVQKGAISLTLGSRILRTETVAPVVLGCLQFLFGDLA